eukprot:jgi/Mesvir1/19522/Mv06899-RA.1
MAGLSLVCQDCGTMLRSAAEAQEHAEHRGHTNFAESTEAVLNLVCTECGKPCRSKTEQELHTQRTGHVSFVDKTAEAAAPIDLQTPLKPMDVEDEDAGAGPSTSEDAATPATLEEALAAVNKEHLSEMEAMGFPQVRCIRALVLSGAESVDGAVTWLIDHEADTDLDTLPPIKKTGPKLSKEQAKAKAEELIIKARQKKEEEEKKLQREQEKERLRIGKELLAAKRIEEEQARKRLIEERRREKEQDARDKQKILDRIAQDKRERRRKLGLPEEEEEPAAPAATLSKHEEKTKMLPVKPITKLQQLKESLRSLKQTHKGEDEAVKLAFQTLLTFVTNVHKAPTEEKYRKIRLTNPTIQKRIGSFEQAIRFLEICGFERVQLDGEDCLVMAAEHVDPLLLQGAMQETQSAITNPFFGAL